jgi:PAS domain S-box-containing protein
VATEAVLLQRIAALAAELPQQRDAHDSTAHILDQVMRQLPALFYVMDRDLRIVRTGGDVEHIVGFPADRFVGTTLQQSLSVEPSSHGAVERHQRALAGEIVQAESTYRGKTLATIVGPHRDAAGEIIGVMGTSIDVTTWRALERRMVDAQRAESLGVLAGGLAHDFNNLLVAVLGNADLALRELREHTASRTAVQNIRTAGLRAAELIEQLLAYAGQGGSGNTRIEPYALVDELLRIIAPSIPANVRVSLEIPTKLAVRGDPAQLRQVMLNLFNNARDAVRDKGGTVTMRAEAIKHDGSTHTDDVLTAPAGMFIILEVADTGPGMDAETRRHVFEPFFTTKQAGHRLGLAALLGIVRAHGGGNRLTSSPGSGARFLVLWPAAVTGPLEAMPASSGARTVLVIDDEDLVRDVVARMVQDLGYAALTAADGKTGLDLIDSKHVDAVLVDLTMPQMSGADVVAVLRQRRPELPVVVCSGYDRDSRGPVQADAYLAKPFRIDALERTLAKLLPLRSV